MRNRRPRRATKMWSGFRFLDNDMKSALLSPLETPAGSARLVPAFDGTQRHSAA
jgi:hypothetical protein